MNYLLPNHMDQAWCVLAYMASNVFSAFDSEVLVIRYEYELCVVNQLYGGLACAFMVCNVFSAFDSELVSFVCDSNSAKGMYELCDVNSVLPNCTDA